MVVLAILLIPGARRAAPSPGWILPALLAALFVALGFSGEAYASRRSELLRHYKISSVPQHRVEVSNTAILGNPDTPHSGLLFLDFGCPVCLGCYHKARQLVARRPDQIHFIVKHYPLDVCNKYDKGDHRGACFAAAAATAAASLGREQGAYAVDYLFRQNSYFPQVLEKLGKQLKAKDWKWNDKRVWDIVMRDIEDAHALKVSGVPVGFLDGRPRDPNHIDKWLRGK